MAMSGGVQMRPNLFNDATPSTSKYVQQSPLYSTSHRRNRGKRCGAVHDTRGQDFNMWSGDSPPIPANYRPGVVPGTRTVATPILSPEKVFDRMYNACHEKAVQHFGAFYSSALGGMITHPAFMVIHMDDHMVHRGHGVFDSVQITDGYLYCLPQHVERLMSSATEIGIAVPYSPESMMRILLDTAAASKKINGTVRFWLTAGRGGFGLSDSECIEPGFYALASDDFVDPDRLVGWNAVSSPIPPQHESVGYLKTTNYLPNVLAQMEAEASGAEVSLFINADDKIMSAANMGVGIITEDFTLVVPPCTGAVMSMTMQRLMELIPQENELSPDDLKIAKVEVRDFTVKEMIAATEAFVLNSEMGVVPIVTVNKTPIGDGEVGIIALALQALLEKDMDPEEGRSDTHIAVPYGYTTGMRSQLM